MERRTWLQGLRGVKLSIFALSIVSVSLLSSVMQSRSASAETFLQKTVDCLVNTLTWKACGNTSASPATPAAGSNGQAATPAKPTTPASSSAASPSSSSSSPSSSASRAPTYSSAQALAPASASDSLLNPNSIKPTDPLPSLPAATYQHPFTYDPVRYASFLYRSFGTSGDAVNDIPATIQPSQEGWKIFGVAWYWWAIGATAAASAGIVIRRRRQTAE